MLRIRQTLAKQATDALPQQIITSSLRFINRLPIRQGTNIYNRDWNLLVILDACRFDMYQEVVGASDYIISVGSTSTEWMDKTFNNANSSIIADTAYISANPYSHRLSSTRFGLLDHVWKDHWSESLGTIPPQPVTDHGIAVARNTDYSRIICHYMQPHFPFIASGEPAFGQLGRGGFGLGEEASCNVWHMLANGKVAEKDVIEAFYRNLDLVFSSVETLLQNVDGTVVITSDHGNAIGEWGMYGHRAYVPNMAIKKVPWDVRESEDDGEYDPSMSGGNQTVDKSVLDQLTRLGYSSE